jgi:hypothetical protein
VVWQQWAPWMCDPIRGQQGWWSRRDIEGLAIFADRFLRAWDDPAEHDIVRYLSRHVLAANHGPTTTEARVAMATAGLEYLSWVDAVLTRGRNPKEHKNLPAKVRIRELLLHAGIDLGTPSELTALGRFCDERGFDGPEAVTWMRNRLIHPKDPAEPYKLQGLLAEVWLLALSYLELCLLHRIGFEGQYMPRWPPGRWEGTTEQVPWTSSAQLDP